ncbi:MAG TPA: uracil-DNA glycosylase [Xanthobacteraceae bacterium]|nr:uracil-DNA glycosylase [Xanthobacteraceae bacterium]
MSAEPSHDCPLCPRLAAFRQVNRDAEPAWFNAPVPSFGPIDAELMIVGLAPGLRGANRTGRPFTGDYAGDLLYATLLEYGFARGKYEAQPDDGFQLVNARIVNSVRCVPPQNKPLPIEIKTCRRFLIAAMQEMTRAKVIVALGKIAHDSAIAAFGQKLSRFKFAHGARHEIKNYVLFDSYHCSRYNTNTGVLTPKMFHAVFAAARKELGN